MAELDGPSVPVTAKMKQSWATPLIIEECQRRLADPRTCEGTRFRGDTWSGQALDLVNPLEFRMKWRWGPLHPFLFVATLTRRGGRTGIEGKLAPHPLLEAAWGVSIFLPELIILTLAGLAVLLAFALRCCVSTLASWLIAGVIVLAGIASITVGSKRLGRRAQDDATRFLHDALGASCTELKGLAKS